MTATALFKIRERLELLPRYAKYQEGVIGVVVYDIAPGRERQAQTTANGWRGRKLGIADNDRAQAAATASSARNEQARGEAGASCGTTADGWFLHLGAELVDARFPLFGGDPSLDPAANCCLGQDHQLPHHQEGYATVAPAGYRLKQARIANKTSMRDSRKKRATSSNELQGGSIFACGEEAEENDQHA